MQEKALQHVPQCTRVGLLAECIATYLNVQKNDEMRFQIKVVQTKIINNNNLQP